MARYAPFQADNTLTAENIDPGVGMDTIGIEGQTAAYPLSRSQVKWAVDFEYQEDEMLQRISAWIQRTLGGRVGLLCLLLFGFFLVFILPGQATGNGTAASPDLSFTYTAEDLYKMAGSYGAQGRADYIHARWTFDLVWPLVYTLGLCAGISFIFRRAFPPASRWQLANLAPVLGAVFDYLENIAATLVMTRYPEPAAAASLAPIFTMVKWIFVGGSLVLVAAGALDWALRTVKRKP